MTNTSKNGGKQTALNLGEQFDEAAYRDKLIAAGSEPATAAELASKMAQVRGQQRERSPLNVGASLNLPPAVKEAVQRVERAQEKAEEANEVEQERRQGVTQQDDQENTRAPRRKTKEQRTRQAVEQILAIQEQSAQDADEVGFIARLLIQATMPHSKPQGNEWTRTNGNLTITMLAPSSVGLPYGSYARLILVWITTQAARNKHRMEQGYITPEEARRLDMGHSLSSFMAELGLSPTGGRWGTIGRLRDQVNRMFKTTISATYTQEDEDGRTVEDDGGARVSRRSHLWWDSKQPDQASLWGSWVELSADFFELITTKPVPLDMRVLRLIKKSPMALDVYCWATYRVSYLKRATVIPWDGLMAQIGASYPDTAQGHRDFRKKFLAGLKKVRAAWPELDATPTEKGLLLKRCAPQVSRQTRGEIPPPQE